MNSPFHAVFISSAVLTKGSCLFVFVLLLKGTEEEFYCRNNFAVMDFQCVESHMHSLIHWMCSQVETAPTTSRRIKSGEVTKYKGIRPRNGKWVSEIRIGGTLEKVWLGSYNTEKEAALAFDAGKHHCSLKKAKGFNFADSPRLLGAPQSFSHLSAPERRTMIQRLAEDHARAYGSADIR